MKDLVIKGTGNSRYLKSSLEGITTWEQFRAALAAGTLPVDLNGINSEGFQQLGDPLNKATLLKDATAAKFGKDTSTVPDEVLDVLSKSVLNDAYKTVDVYAGQNWEKGTVASASGSVWQWICVANNILFSLPQSGTAAIMSTDGKAWTTLTVPAIESNYAYNIRHVICYANGTYYLIQYRAASSYGFRVYSSPDLKTWTSIATVTGLRDSVCGFFYSQSLSKFLIFDLRGNIAMSDDAVTWVVGALNLTDTEFGHGMSNMLNAECCVDGPDGFYLALPNDSTKKIRIFKISASKTEIIWESNAISWRSQYCAFVKFKGKYYVYNSNGIATSDNLTDWDFVEKEMASYASLGQTLTASNLSVIYATYGDASCVSTDGLNFAKSKTPSVDGSVGNLAYINGVFAFHQYGSISSISAYYTPDTTFKDEPGLVDVLGNMVDIPLKQIAGAAGIEIGTYTGTGTSSYKDRVLTFSNPPKFVLVAAGLKTNSSGDFYKLGFCFLFPTLAKGVFWAPSSPDAYQSQDITVDGNSISWRVTNSQQAALCDVASIPYYYFGLY